MKYGESMTAEDKKWQAECDARTLADAEAIKKDEERLNAAKEAAKTMVDEKQAEAEAMAKVASGVFSYPSHKNE